MKIFTKWLMILLLSYSFNTFAASKDYGVGHVIISEFAGHVLTDINGVIFPPRIARVVTDVELALITYHWCNREQRARGSWDIEEWNTDSQLDCILPAITNGYRIFVNKDGIFINILDYRW